MPVSLCAVRLFTGRSHQIRAQFASRGMPLLGDGKYGSRQKCPIALFAHRLTFCHPITGKTMTFSLPVTEAFPWDQFALEKTYDAI
jgi:23S rRNA pseudouridine1911/1915/1917 synthase